MPGKQLAGRPLSDKSFARREQTLRSRLLQLQFALRDAGIPMLILVSGVEGAGKGQVAARLNKWLDARGVQTTAFWEESEEQRRRPLFWRFWKVMPARGRIGLLFGSWYTQPLVKRALQQEGRKAFEARLMDIRCHEQMLVEDGMVIVKLWFHMGLADVKRQLARDAQIGKLKLRTTPLFQGFDKLYRRFVNGGERMRALTDSHYAPWHVVEASDANARDYRVGRIVMAAMEKALKHHRQGMVARKGNRSIHKLMKKKIEDRLSQVDLKQHLSAEDYGAALAHYQQSLQALAWRAHHQRHTVILAFEGWDAAGKGGTIRRITEAVDARLYQVVSVGPPSDEERAHHYLWRFWRHLPMSGYLRIFDRSWYGRVLVERVEGLASPQAWQRAYQEIRLFESQLLEEGNCTLLKFWLHISPEEQLRRFQAREDLPWKQHKLTPDDWRNRDRWQDYSRAVNDMVDQTSTPQAPWILVPADDKRFARIQVLNHLCNALEKTGGPPP